MSARWKVLAAHHLFWPVVVLVGLIVANVIYRPSFVSVEMRDGHLYGSLIDIVRLSHRVVVLRDRKVVAVRDNQGLTADDIMATMAEGVQA